jgi:glycosyltransferase involved in cell wall biosynthesis
MEPPRFSIVVPTRERTETLRHTLRTCLRQDFDDYEIVVSDNGRTSATRDLIRGLADPRVRCVSTPRPLAMSANFEHAVSHARGEYLLVVGDDDGLLPFCLREIDVLVRRTGARIVRWTPATYTWPTVALAGQGNYLGIPLARHFRVADGREEVRKAVGTWDYTGLPMLYINSAVHREVLDLIRARAGRVFGCRLPDVYSGFVLGYLSGQFLAVTVPLTVAGVSGRSTGVAALFRDQTGEVARDFGNLNAECGFFPHPHVPDLPLFPVAPVAESFLRAKEAFFPDDGELVLPRRTILENCARCLWAEDDGLRAGFFARIREAAADDPGLLAAFDSAFPGLPPAAPAPRLRQPLLGSDGDNLHLDASEFGVTDIGGAVELAARLLGVGRGPMRYDLRMRAEEAGERHGRS